MCRRQNGQKNPRLKTSKTFLFPRRSERLTSFPWKSVNVKSGAGVFNSTLLIISFSDSKSSPLAEPGSGRAVPKFFHARAAQLGESPCAVEITEDEQDDGCRPARQRVHEGEFIHGVALKERDLPE